MTATIVRPALPALVPSRRSGHLLFAIVLAAAAGLRALVMIGYTTAQLYWYDSFTYLDTALHLRPGGAFHPAGYSWFLWPFSDVRVVVGVQHLMGLGVGVMIYLLLRRWSVPGWAATLATLPVLFDPAFIRLEHAILSDLQVYFLIIAALTLLMWRVSIWSGAAAGLLLALAGLTRTAAVPLLGLALLYLLVRRAGWRPVAALVLAGALPLAAYAGWYQQHNGRFALSGADGVSLWARTMTFADCARVELTPEEAKLCPNGTVVDAASEYVWAAGASLNRLPGGRFANNDLARSFATKVILAQPLDYLGEVVGDTSLAFTWTPVAHPKRMSPALSFPKGSWDLPWQFPLVQKIRSEYDGVRGMASVEPFGTILAGYRYPWFLHGTLFGVILLAGGVSAALWRRAALLPWAMSMFLLVGPIAALDFDHRYVLPSIPLACLAAAMGLHGMVTAVRAGRSRARASRPS